MKSRLNEQTNLTMETAGPVNHVFVDFENVHDIDLAVISTKAVTFTLLLGAKQKQLKVEIVEQLLRNAAAVKLIRLESSGKNALDFAIAYYVGRAVAADPTGSFHVISRDKGFDPLIEHLRAKHTDAYRHDDFSTLGFLTVKTAAIRAEGAVRAPSVARLSAPAKRSLAADGRLTRLIAHLKTAVSNRPSSKAKLVRDVVHFFAKEQLTDAVAKGLINQLRQRALISIDPKGAVTYNFPAEESATVAANPATPRPQAGPANGENS